jgi:ketosteroid isomerase-like protein
MKSTPLLFAIAVLFASCTMRYRDTSEDSRKKTIEEIERAEKDFQKMSAEKGIMQAFWYYADSNAVIKRQNDSLIHGKEAIRNFYSAPFYAQASVTWSPDFTDVSAQGDFGYTYGKYTWQSKDSTGKVTEYKGIFHTVWKRQADGSWKYVWD